MAGYSVSMERTTATPRQSIVDDIHQRLTFRKRRATQSLVLSILLWYIFQIGTLYLGWTVEQWQWLFTTASFPALSPGLVFAIISHIPPPNVTHLLGNVTFLWLFAGESEQHMSGAEVLWFFVVTALVAVTINSAVTGQSTLGASGGALAFLGFFVGHLLLAHREALQLDTSDYGLVDDEAVRAYWQGAVLLFPVGVGMYLLGQSVGLISAGNTAVISHLVGLVLGMGYAVGREWVK